MQTSNIPSKFTYAFASGASGSYIRSVPATTVDPTAASQQLGFPSATFTPTASGGAAPDGRDFNGLFNQVTAWQIWGQAGGPITYDGGFQTTIGGYPRNAVVLSATTPGKFWMSTTENNITNPDTGGAGWTAWIFGAGIGSAVTSITAGLGLAGGTITSSGTISLLQASTSQLGGVKVDGTSIVISGGGVISSTGGGGGGGGVSSVGLELPSIFLVSGSPVTSAGTLSAVLVGQTANMFFAGPASGGASAPLFRTIVSADMPAATNSQRGAVQTDGVTTMMVGSVIKAIAGSVSSVNASGGSTGLSFSGGPITSSGTFTLAGTLGIPNGGTGSTTQSGARTNLGLGTLATQNSNAVSITGGTIAGVGLSGLTAPLAVADGGTGVTTSTGTGATVRGTAPTLSTLTVSSGGAQINGSSQVTGTLVVTTEIRSSAEVTCGNGGRGIRGSGGSALQLFSGDGGTANLTVAGMTAVAFTPTSDERLKEEILPTAGMGLSVITALAGARYKLKGNGQRGSGVIAQQVRDVLPHLVHEDANGYLAVNYDGLWAYAIEAIKELAACSAKH